MKKKYEFTGETKLHLGVELKRIRAITAFGIVAAGTLGGWVASEKSLSHDGNAWVSGNAWVYGDAHVSGNARVYGDARVYGNAWVYGDAHVYGDARVSGNARVSPIVIAGLYYHVTITDTDMSIGCEFHSIAEWEVFDDAAILKMDGKAALKFWRSYGKSILHLAAESGRPIEVTS